MKINLKKIGVWAFYAALFLIAPFVIIFSATQLAVYSSDIVSNASELQVAKNYIIVSRIVMEIAIYFFWDSIMSFIAKIKGARLDRLKRFQLSQHRITFAAAAFCIEFLSLIQRVI